MDHCPFKFALIVVALMLSTFMSALDQTAVATALPVIVNSLHGRDIAWVGTAFLPMSGGLAEIFGRRSILLISLGIFTLGSALCGSAKSMNWLIAARAIQGVGSGGITSLSSIVISDLITLQDRGIYNALLGLSWALAASMGPLIGGVLAGNGQWRWLFYLNLPLGGICIAIVFFFLDFPTPPGSMKEKFKRLDWIGIFLVLSSTTSVIIALSWGGTKYPWSDGRIISALVLGVCGMAVFILYELRYADNPMVPHTLLSNRSSVSGYIQTFLAGLVIFGINYYIPVYYQACQGASVVHSGVDMLGISVSVGPSAVLAGVSVTMTNRYRPQLWIGWIILLVGISAFAVRGETASLREAVGIPILIGVGGGMLASTTYFPVLAPLPVTENAHALAFFAYCRTFSGIWGVAIGAAVLQNQLAMRLSPAFLAFLPEGGQDVGILNSLVPRIKFLEDGLKQEIQQAFAKSLTRVWTAMTTFTVLGLFASFFMPDVPLQNLIDKKWTMPQARTQGSETPDSQFSLAAASRDRWQSGERETIDDFEDCNSKVEETSTV
ncbi:Mfs1.2 [Mycena floridula]|nr:Mfs1.2 [Mycena floridula]